MKAILNTYKFHILIGFALMSSLIFTSIQSSAISTLKDEIAVKQGVADESERTLRLVETEFDKEEFVEKVETRETSARKIGEEIIAVDNALTAYYKSSNPLPEDPSKHDAFFAELEKVKAENTRLTGAGEHDHISTWQLNPEWTLKLESVVTYRDVNQFPVLFSMTTKEGKPAGLIRAIYDVDEHILSSVTPQYTSEGMRDQADIGGI